MFSNCKRGEDFENPANKPCCRDIYTDSCHYYPSASVNSNMLMILDVVILTQKCYKLERLCIKNVDKLDDTDLTSD